MVEELSQTAHGGACVGLRAVASRVFVQAGPSGIVVVGVGLGYPQGRQGAGMALEAGILLAHECWAWWCSEGDDEVDALGRRCAVGRVVVEVGGSGAVGA